MAIKKKILTVVPDRCTGCLRCELHCSFFHEKSIDPTQKRIFVIRAEPAVDTPIICTQCGLCEVACPVPGAMVRNGKTGAIEVTDKCTACGQCVMVCPYGVIRISEKSNKAIKCDLCGGDPSCVEACPFGALEYADQDRANFFKQLSYARKSKREITAG